MNSRFAEVVEMAATETDSAPPERTLLVAVDDSDDSVRAFEWCLENIYRGQDSLHLVHVVPR